MSDIPEATSTDRNEVPWIEIRQCHSYNRAGERCEHPAGHTGKHYISVEWSDAEAWTPTPAGMGVQIAATDPALVEHLTNMKVMCIVCDHPDHRGMCGLSDGDFDCDCAEGIPG